MWFPRGGNQWVGERAIGAVPLWYQPGGMAHLHGGWRCPRARRRHWCGGTKNKEPEDGVVDGGGAKRSTMWRNLRQASSRRD